MVIKGEFADGSPMVAIPNFVRNNRIPETPAEEAGPRRRGRRGGESIVWIRDE
jgi:hypothetical protein